MILIDVCELIVDCPHSTANDEGAGYPLIRTPNVGKGRLILDGVHRVSKQVYDVRNARAVPKAGDLILAREAPAGNVAIIMEGQEVCLGQRTVLIRPDKSKVNPQYLTYYLLAPYAQHELTSAANGATVAHVNMPKIRGLKINLPDIQGQNRIAGFLSTYDDLIATNQKQIALLEEAAQRIYKEWFIDFHFPGYENTPIEYGVPKGWFYQPLSDVFDYVRGKSYTSSELSEDSGTLMVNLKNIRAFGGYKRNEEKRFTGDYKESQTLAPGDVVMGVTDMTQERRLVGHVAMIPDMKEPMTFSMDIIKIVPKTVTRNFLYSACFYGGFSKQISPLANGVNVLHLKPEAMMNLQMLVPTQKLIEQYDTIFEPIRCRIETLQNQCILAEEARNRLLPKLMSGNNND